MTVTLDAPPQDPTWKAQCDVPGCHSRLYLQARDADHAASRAVVEYGWGWDEETATLTCSCVHEAA